MNTTAPVKSFRDLEKNGDLKRADASRVRLDAIHFEDKFNPPDRVPIGANNELIDDEDKELYQHLFCGGVYSPLEVRPRAEGGVYVVEGHRRVILIRRAIEAGAQMADKDGVVWIPVTQFMGNDVDRIARTITSNNQKPLTPIQICTQYKKLRAFNLDASEIAMAVNKSESHVKTMLALGDANHDVQQLVKDGAVSVTLATATVKEHGENAGAVLKAAESTAKAKGKAKITAKSMPKPVKEKAKDKGYLSDTDLLNALEDHILEFGSAKILNLASNCQVHGIREAIKALKA